MKTRYLIRKSFITIVFVALSLFANVFFAQAEKQSENLSIGERFHNETSMTWWGAIGDIFRSKPKRPPQYKKYKGAKIIKLPEPEYKGMALEDAIRKRRSLRDYSKRPITVSQLSQLVFAGGNRQDVRTGPSHCTFGRGLISILVVNRVEGLPQGIYHYAVLDHALELVKEGDFRSSITKAGLDQDMLGDSNVTFVLTAIFDRVRHKYGERGFRYAYIEAGHISQNIFLQAVSLGLGSVSVGAFLDEELNQLIGIDGIKETAIYLHAVGTP